MIFVFVHYKVLNNIFLQLCSLMVDKAFIKAWLIFFASFFTYFGYFKNEIRFPIYASIGTQPVRTLFMFKSIWTRPQGSQGCQKIRFIFLQIKLLSFCANIAPERHKLQKIIKIGEKCQKTPVFLDLFEYSSIWGQY